MTSMYMYMYIQVKGQMKSNDMYMYIEVSRKVWKEDEANEIDKWWDIEKKSLTYNENDEETLETRMPLHDVCVCVRQCFPQKKVQERLKPHP